MMSTTAIATSGASMQPSGGFQGAGYTWFIYGSSRHGFADTHEEAKVGWRKAYGG
jgi:hypothetical protein